MGGSMNREEMIEKLVEYRVDNFDLRELADVFIGGIIGYDEMSDEEVKDQYKLFFEEAV
jgi:hypothetical protein